MNADDLTVDHGLITKTATGSLSFGGAALLIEEILSKALRTEARGLKEDSDSSRPMKRGIDNN